MKGYLLACVSIVSFVSTVNAADLYVDGTGSGVSCSATSPCPQIQTAVDLANIGDTIHVASGVYSENVNIGTPASPNSKPGITITGAGIDNTIVVSAGISGQRPAGVLADIIFDIWSADVTIEKLTVEHPTGSPSGRDIGFFVSPHGENVIIRKTKVVRNRTGSDIEPTAPGSRGVLVFKAGNTLISKNVFTGNYQDHIHMPTHDSEISKNRVYGATRLGIVIIQEDPTSNNTNNLIIKNIVSHSGNDGIQIQGNNNEVLKNKLKGNAGAAIKLCGEPDNDPNTGDNDCIPPFDQWAIASENTVLKNKYSNNGVNGIVDNGVNNTTD